MNNLDQKFFQDSLGQHKESERTPETLYYFTTDFEQIEREGFRGSSFIDKGIGGRGQSLIGTYFFSNLDDMDNYRPLTKHIEKKSGKQGRIIRAELDASAKILDSSNDDNASYMNEVRSFKETTDLELGTPEFQKELTKFLREKGYDAVKIKASLLGPHIEIIVINEDKLIYKGDAKG